MQHNPRSIRPFLGARDFDLSRRFYHDLGFEENVLGHNFSYFQIQGYGFYLQDAYVREWIDNTQVFLEVDDARRYWNELMALDLPARYDGVRLTPLREYDWGRECFLHDPSGILWHFGEFYPRNR